MIWVNVSTNYLTVYWYVVYAIMLYYWYSFMINAVPVVSYLELFLFCDFLVSVGLTQWRPGFTHVPCLQRSRLTPNWSMGKCIGYGGYGSWPLLSFKAAGTACFRTFTLGLFASHLRGFICRCWPLRHKQGKMAKSRWTVLCHIANR